MYILINALLEGSSYRSETPLIYKAVPSWLIRVESIEDKLLANNKKFGNVCKICVLIYRRPSVMKTSSIRPLGLSGMGNDCSIVNVPASTI